LRLDDEKIAIPRMESFDELPGVLSTITAAFDELPMIGVPLPVIIVDEDDRHPGIARIPAELVDPLRSGECGRRQAVGARKIETMIISMIKSAVWLEPLSISGSLLIISPQSFRRCSIFLVR
jgi:hypothetical protein